MNAVIEPEHKHLIISLKERYMMIKMHGSQCFSRPWPVFRKNHWGGKVIMSQIIIIIIIILIMKRHRENPNGERSSHPIDSGFFSGLVMMFFMSLKHGAGRFFEGKISHSGLEQHPRSQNFGNCKMLLGLVRRIRTVSDRSPQTRNNRQGRPRPAGNSSILIFLSFT